MKPVMLLAYVAFTDPEHFESLQNMFSKLNSRVKLFFLSVLKGSTCSDILSEYCQQEIKAHPAE